MNKPSVNNNINNNDTTSLSDGGVKQSMSVGDDSSKRLYLDNAATSYPKPSGVMQAMVDYAANLGASPGRGAYRESREAAQLLYKCRGRINELINGEAREQVVFTLNCSDALNLAIKGLVDYYNGQGKKCHVITTWMDHNSILRPVNELVNKGMIEQTRVECDPITGMVDPEDICKVIKPHTRLIATLHGSNVSGTLQPISEIGLICREHSIAFLVDAAQTLGHIPVDVQDMHIDLLAFPGHKGLLGPLGTGGLYLKPGMEKFVNTLREGGTGSVSEDDVQPGFMPDKYEPGSHNALGIVGLSEGIAWLQSKGIDNLRAHEVKLIRLMLDRLTDCDSMPGLHLYGSVDAGTRCGVFSVRHEQYTPDKLAQLLENEFGLLTRSGLHCAPLAHKTFGTDKFGGTVRLSFSPFISIEDVDYICGCLAAFCQKHTKVTSY